MAKALLTQDTWVLVADGGRALVLRNEGDETYPNLKVVQTYRLDNPPTRDQGTDRPGISGDAFGHNAAVETTDFHQQAEDRFMHQLAADLDSFHTAGAFKALVIAAPPTALGELRKSESASLKKAIVADFHKDWTHLPVFEIEKAIAKALGE